MSSISTRLAAAESEMDSAADHDHHGSAMVEPAPKKTLLDLTHRVCTDRIGSAAFTRPSAETR